MSPQDPQSSDKAQTRIYGSGEMASHIRTMEWSKTPLGPIERWSDILVASVNFLIASPFTFAIYWGDEHTLIYNDRYRQLLGQKHPAALGGRGRDVWAEAWHVIGPLIRAAYREGESSSDTEAFIPTLVDGRLQDGWYTYGFHPIYENGRIAGVGNPGQDNTAAVLARRLTEESEAKLSQVLGATTDAVVSVDRNWIMTYLNPKAMEVYALHRDVLGQNFWEAFPHAVYKGSPFVEHYYRAMDQRIAGHFETFYPEPLNIWIRLEVYPTPDGIVTFSRDVTAEKKEHLLLREKEAKLTIATDALGLGIFTWFPETDEVEWENDRIYSIIGRPRELGPVNAELFVRTLIFPEFAAGFEKALGEAVWSGSSFRFECKINVPYASPRWVCFTGQMEMHLDGRPFRMVGAVQDMTKSREAEEALRISDVRLRLAQESAKISTWEWELSSGNFIWDEGSAWTYGRPQDQMTHVDQIFPYLVAEDRARVAEDVRPAMEGRGNYRSQFRVVWPDGSVHWLDAWGRTVFAPDGKPLKIIGVNVDVTDRKLSEAALIQNEKLAVVGRLASSIAHEINNPLEAVTNLLYLAKRSTAFEEALAYLDVAEIELRRTSAIASQTLQFHKQSSKPAEVSPEDLIESVLMIHYSRFLNARVRVERRLRSEKTICCFDGEIRQVLNNLVTNAIDAMSQGGGQLYVRTREGREWATGAEGTVFTVADTGSGMAKDTVKKVFEAFFTTKGIGGTGLGMWISKSIVDRHRGKLRVRTSQVPSHRGTVFTMFLPFPSSQNVAENL